MLPRWILWVCGAFVLFGAVMFASPGHCEPAPMPPDVAARLGEVKAELLAVKEQVKRLVDMQDAEMRRRPAYEADLIAVRETVMGEVREVKESQRGHAQRISELEAARLYALGALLVLGAVLGLWLRGRRLEVQQEKAAPAAVQQAPPAPPPPHA